MAVPKRKTSMSRRGARRSHHGLSFMNVVYHEITGEPMLPHRISSDGFYGKIKVASTRKERKRSNASKTDE